MKTVLPIILFVLTALPLLAAPQVNNGDITDVIVYHGQALVTRTIELGGSVGDIELLVENLPEKILPESLYALSNNGIQVLSVRYREKTTTEDNRQEVKDLEKQIYGIDRQIRNNTRNIQNANERIERFCDQWKFVTDTSKVEMENGVLNAKTIIELNEFMAARNKKIHDEILTLENQNLDLEKQKAELSEQLQKLRNARRDTTRQALVYLHVPETAASNAVQFSYLVNGADWSPQYNLKADADAERVRIEYNAVVHQSSGEDWTNAALALSTAVPALVASPPELEPMKIGLISGEVRYRAAASNKKPVQVAEQPGMQKQDFYAYTDRTKQFGTLIQSRRSNIAKGIKAQQKLNTIAISNQMIEFEADKRMVRRLQQQAIAVRRTGGVSVMYSLPGKLTLPSKSDQQLVTIASLDTPAEFVFVAAPLLTDYVYLQADITNDSDTILLPGKADMFRSGEFVGNADMKLVTIGQSFTIGFGVDSQIQVTREFKDKKTDSFLGNRIDENYYRLAIDNYYDKPVALRLTERLPWTENKELAIELTNVSHPLSTNAEYLRTERDKGILRWDLQLAPNTTSENATIINYAFTLKYDNDMTIRTIR